MRENWRNDWHTRKWAQTRRMIMTLRWFSFSTNVLLHSSDSIFMTLLAYYHFTKLQANVRTRRFLEVHKKCLWRSQTAFSHFSVCYRQTSRVGSKINCFLDSALRRNSFFLFVFPESKLETQFFSGNRRESRTSYRSVRWWKFFFFFCYLVAKSTSNICTT